MRKWIAILTIALFAVGTSYGAMLGQGTRELVVEGDLDFDSADGTVIDLSIGYGTFIQDGVEVGVEVAILDSDTVQEFGGGVFGEMNFDSGSELVPFVGVSANYLSVEVDLPAPAPDADDDAIVLGAQAGAKYFIAENVAISGALVYEWATEDIFAEDRDLEDTNLSVDVGMRFFF